MILTFINIASCYYSIYKYAKYFAKRHPKVIEDERAVAIVLKLEEESHSDDEKSSCVDGRSSFDSSNPSAPHFTVTAIGTGLGPPDQEHQQGESITSTDVVDFATAAAPTFQREPREGSTVPASRRPFSWQRTTSRARPDSTCSPLDEDRPHSHFSSPDMAEPAVHEDNPRRSVRTSIRWSLPRTQLDVDYYTSTFADNSNPKRASHKSDRSRSWMIINEGDEGEGVDIGR